MLRVDKEPICNDDICAICLDDLKAPDKGGYGKLDCSHCYHVKCLFEWYDRSEIDEDTDEKHEHEPTRRILTGTQA